MWQYLENNTVRLVVYSVVRSRDWQNRQPLRRFVSQVKLKLKLKLKLLLNGFIDVWREDGCDVVWRHFILWQPRRHRQVHWQHSHAGLHRSEIYWYLQLAPLFVLGWILATPAFLFLTFVFSPWDFYSLGQNKNNNNNSNKNNKQICCICCTKPQVSQDLTAR